MALDYTIFNLAGCHFPRGKTSLLPRLNPLMFIGSKGRYGSAFLGHETRYYKLGRYALYGALRLAGVGPRTTVLMPAYHCRTVLDPAISLGGEVRLYPLTAGLAPDLHALDRLLGASPEPIQAMVLIHYFGWPQDMAPVQAWCAERDIQLIEDCSHLLWGPQDKPLPGMCSHFAAASPYKLVPGDLSGVLISRAGRLNPLPPVQRLSWLEQCQGLARSLDKAVTQWRHRLDRKAIAALPAQIRSLQQANVTCGHDELRLGERCPSPLYRVEEEHEGGSLWSCLTFRLAPFERIAAQRRKRYGQWLQGLAGTPHCKPLFSDLPNGVTPAFFPLLIEYPDPHFFLLKHLGVPIWRWDELAVSDCPVSQHYRLHLLHLPCHQGLTDTEMDWLLTATDNVLRTRPGEAHS